MIIQNGTIEVKNKVAMGINPLTGYPIKPTEVSYGDAIPCQYSANMYNQLGRSNGESFTTAQYSILIEQPSEPFTAEQVRLKDMVGNVIGTFSIISIEPLDAVCQLRISV